MGNIWGDDGHVGPPLRKNKGAKPARSSGGGGGGKGPSFYKTSFMVALYLGGLLAAKHRREIGTVWHAVVKWAADGKSD